MIIERTIGCLALDALVQRAIDLLVQNPKIDYAYFREYCAPAIKACRTFCLRHGLKDEYRHTMDDMIAPLFKEKKHETTTDINPTDWV